MKKVIIALLVSFVIYELYLYQKKINEQKRIEEQKRMEEQKRIEEEEKRIEEEQKRMEVPVWKRITLYLFFHFILANLQDTCMFIFSKISRIKVEDIEVNNKIVLKIILLINIFLSILIAMKLKKSTYDKIYKNMFYIFLLSHFLRFASTIYYKPERKIVTYFFSEILNHLTLGLGRIVYTFSSEEFIEDFPSRVKNAYQDYKKILYYL